MTYGTKRISNNARIFRTSWRPEYVQARVVNAPARSDYFLKINLVACCSSAVLWLHTRTPWEQLSDETMHYKVRARSSGDKGLSIVCIVTDKTLKVTLTSSRNIHIVLSPENAQLVQLCEQWKFFPSILNSRSIVHAANFNIKPAPSPQKVGRSARNNAMTSCATLIFVSATEGSRHSPGVVCFAVIHRNVFEMTEKN